MYTLSTHSPGKTANAQEGNPRLDSDGWGKLLVMAVVRLREPGDLDVCVIMLAAVHERDEYPLQWPGDPQLWLTPADLVSAWVALVDEELVGHIALVGGGRSERSARDERAEISRLFVAPTSRGRGVGAQLLDVVTREGDLRGWKLRLEVVEGRSAATQFYERHGWCLEDRKPASWMTATGHRPVVRHYAQPARSESQ